MVNFLVECIILDEPLELEEVGHLVPTSNPPIDTWEIYIDRSSNFEVSGVGIVIVRPGETIVEHPYALNSQQ